MAAPASTSRTALVTGGNRGIGHEVCRQLAAAGWHVLLAARDATAGRQAAAELNAEAAAAGGSVNALTLDVADPAAIRALAEGWGDRGPLQALVNNAGVSLRGFGADVVRGTLAVNVHGALALTDALRPRLAARASVVMVSSGMGDLSVLGPPVRARMADPDLDRAGLEALLAEFEAAVAQGRLRGSGWPQNAYSVSKAALNAVTRILAREWGPDGPRVNSVCPGWVRTGMGGRAAPRSVKVGAKGIVWAATLPPDGPTGGCFRDGKPIPW